MICPMQWQKHDSTLLHVFLISDTRNTYMPTFLFLMEPSRLRSFWGNKKRDIRFLGNKKFCAEAIGIP